jgi:predicted TIM-barrel fold metal-dependent hydrolase
MSDANGRLISADSHVMEPVDLWEKTLLAEFGDDTPRVLDGHLGKEGKFFNTGGQIMEYGGSDRDSQKIGMQEAGWDPVVRVAFQEKAEVAAEVLNATFMLLIMRHPNYACLRACARVFNDWLAEFISHNPKRLLGIGMIPMDDVDWAIEELERCAKNGFRGVNIQLYSPPGSPPYRKPAYDPFWARAAEMDIPIQLHIITGRVPDPIHFHTPEEQQLSPQTQIAMFYEVTGVLVNEFIFGKILDRHPKLRVVCSEFELSWIPNFMWRLDHMQEAMAHRLVLPKLDMKASDYMRQRIWHGVIDDLYATETIEYLGADRVLWGSDFPHIRSIGLEARGHVAKAFEPFSAEDQSRLTGGNAAEVFNIN